MRAEKLGDALVSAGLSRAEMEFGAAVIKFLKSGGTAVRAHALIDATAERMSGRGHVGIAVNGHTNYSPTRQPVEDGAASSGLPSGQLNNASPSSFNRGGEGRIADAQESHSRCALPVREPKPQRAAIDFGEAAHAIKTRLAQTVLDRVKTSDGRAWGDVGAHELDGMWRDGALARAIRDHIGVLSNTQRFMTVRDLVNAETFEAIRSKVHGA